MGRPRKFYLVYRDTRPTTIAHGLAELHRMTGSRTGTGFAKRETAETFAAWRDYRYGFPFSVHNPRRLKGDPDLIPGPVRNTATHRFESVEGEPD